MGADEINSSITNGYRCQVSGLRFMFFNKFICNPVAVKLIFLKKC